MFVWFRALLPCYKCNILLSNSSIPPGSHITLFKVQHSLYLRWKCIFRPSIRSADRKQAAYLFPHHLFSLRSPQDVNGAISAPLINQCVREGGRERERGEIKGIIVFRLNWWTLALLKEVASICKPSDDCSFLHLLLEKSLKEKYLKKNNWCFNLAINTGIVENRYVNTVYHYFRLSFLLYTPSETTAIFTPQLSMTNKNPTEILLPICFQLSNMFCYTGHKSNLLVITCLILITIDWCSGSTFLPLQ